MSEDKVDAVELELPAANSAPKQARDFVHAQWPQLGDEVLGDVTLIVSELVSNAIRHGQPQIVLRLQIEPLAVDVSVLDHRPTLPSVAVQPVDFTATSGRGLSLISELANSWGVTPLTDAPGKTVWASVVLP